MRQRAGRGAGYSLLESEDDRSSGNDHVHRLSRESHSQRVLAERSAGFGLGNGVALNTGCRRRSSTLTSILPLFPLSCPLPENMPPASTAFAMNICQPDAGGRGYIPLADHGLLVFFSFPPPTPTPYLSFLPPRSLSVLFHSIGNLHTAALVCSPRPLSP